MDSVELETPPGLPWNVFVGRARSKWDMRRARRDLRCMGNGTPCSAACEHRGSINVLDRESNGGNICSVDQFKGSWERVPVTVDSGAIDSVIPKRVAKGVPVKQTEASRRGLKYRAANGTSIANEGEKSLRGYTNEANLVDMSMQVANVTKPLGSVRAMLKAGNRVVFDEGDSFILNKATGVRTNIEDRNGAFVFDIWVPRGKDEKEDTGYQGKYWQALVEEEEEDRASGFARLDDLVFGSSR